MKLGEHAAAREAATFVAREAELAVLATLLDTASPHRVALVSGAAGVGKTALLREAVRRGRGRGYQPVWLDARELREGRSLPAVLAEAAGLDRPLLVVDSAEDLGDGERLLRDEGLALLPAAARAVLGSRRPLDPAWWGSPWAASIVTVPVGPFESGAASAFLAARGIREPDEANAVLAWAEGHVLSLTLAAAVRGAVGRPLDAVDLNALETDLLDHLTGGRLEGAELVGTDRLVLSVAALAPAVDAALLAAVLPGQDGVAAERWLRTLPFAERLGHRVTLHQRVRRLLAAQVRHAEPQVERDLRLRIIDHLTGPGRTGRPELVLDVREVLAPPQDHGVTPSRALSSPWRPDVSTPADAAAVAVLLGDQDPAYTAWVLRWVTEAPDHVLVVRRPGAPGDVVALAVWATSDVVPAAFADDPVLGRWLAAAAGWSGATLFQPVTEVRVADVDLPEVSAVVLSEVVQRCGLPDFRRWVVPRKPPAPDPSLCGGVPDPRFDLAVGRQHHPGHVIDYGPEGVLTAMRDEAHGVLAAPPASHEPPPVGAADVRDALRHAHDPVWLATSALAVGTSPAERATSVVTLLRDAVEQAFGDGRDARLQREVLQRGYLDPEANHTRAMRSLHLSRTTYFRRLREATATLTAWLTVRV